MANTLRVAYLGTNVGKIYFTDVDKRSQLGGAQEGNFNCGQDEYIMWGETKVLQITDNVLFSMAKGVLKYFSTTSSNATFSARNGAPLVLTEGSYTSADEVPRQDIGDTGTSRFTDTYMDKLSNDKYSTGAAGSTGYYYGNA